ncbi:MAG: hypothetical protein FWB83_06010 [Treponema sp.]|nr:hypothetical protein [Treponema sp.]
MSYNINQHSFWGSLSPLGGLTGAGILIMASARLSWAVTAAGCLFWVYGLTAIAYSFLLSANKYNILPVQGRSAVFTCIAVFFGSIYALLFWLLCPFAAFEVFLILMLVPLFCANSCAHIHSTAGNSHSDIYERLMDAVSMAGTLAGLLAAFSILREPLAFCSLSFPGTYQGMITIMYFSSGSFFPIGIFASSCGALLLLGYFVCLYQYGRNKLYPGEYK